MTDHKLDRKRSKESGPGTDDTTEYSASKAPETRAHAEGRSPDAVSDDRLEPGGPRGAEAGVGMDGMDRDEVPNRAASPGQTDFGEVDTTSKID
jgi:hypothetical protein